MQQSSTQGSDNLAILASCLALPCPVVQDESHLSRNGGDFVSNIDLGTRKESKDVEEGRREEGERAKSQSSFIAFLRTRRSKWVSCRNTPPFHLHLLARGISQV